ncbi:MAG: 23S rRNA (pseudouridine(1915)-N(3))-methyltransferase RlmH [Desulfotomaculum sp.]|nr:23S rRNA (pseudouridine(1915)-N(3))-methyltransferase RlmH [Desulfotomaculum sp.]MCL0081224.1 23S rRNA (pseudouridine(1915)-N(3))-methyltransferase RlmH [Peptococcaceae bacterium]
MQITIIAAGKLKENYLRQGVQEYLKRLQPFAKLKIIEVADEFHSEKLSDIAAEQVRQREAKRISKHLKPDAFLIALDITGKMYNSEEMADYFQKLMLTGKSNITLLIGGSLGISSELLRRSQLRISFSKLTFPHQLMRLILLEQIYRVFKIFKGEPYHK